MSEIKAVNIGALFVNNLLSIASLLWVITVLLLGLCFLLPVALVDFLLRSFTQTSRYADFTGRQIENIYCLAVSADTFWMEKVVGISLNIIGEKSQHPSPVVICNHQSWFDIPVIQQVISGDGPMVRFLIKRELVWVPIIGWICSVLNFPLLSRNKDTESRQADMKVVQRASVQHGQARGALLLFPEGTRFSALKKASRQSKYSSLLQPKSGGLRLIKEHVESGTPLIDLTIKYHCSSHTASGKGVLPVINLWRCLHGEPREITVTIEHFILSEIDDIEEWLNRRWQIKDALLS